MSRTAELGSSDSARSRQRIQVTMAADGISSGTGPYLVPPLEEQVPVVPAGQVGARDHRGGLAERQRLAAERLGEVDSALALDRVHGEPFGQAVQRLPGAEEPDRDDPCPGRPDGESGPRCW